MQPLVTITKLLGLKIRFKEILIKLKDFKILGSGIKII